jgi:hypothetical protein
VFNQYPLSERLLWLFRQTWPVMGEERGMPRAPASRSIFQAQSKVRLVFLGDVMRTHREWVPQVSPSLQERLGEADLVFANCEGPVLHERIARRPLFTIRYAMAREYVEQVMAVTRVPASRWVWSLANNHVGDFGGEGVEKTAATLRSLGANVVGLKPWDLIEVGSERLAIQAWTQWENHSIGRALPESLHDEALSKGHRPNIIRGGAPPSERHLARIALPHWGLEFRYFPSAEQRQWALQWVQNDVRLIVGHHGHVVQPLEWFDHSQSPSLAAYGIGNWLGVQWSWPTKNFGALVVDLETLGERRGQIAHYEMLCLHRASRGRRTPEIRLFHEQSERQGESEAIFRRVGWLANREPRS